MCSLASVSLPTKPGYSDIQFASLQLFEGRSMRDNDYDALMQRATTIGAELNGEAAAKLRPSCVGWSL